MDSATHQLLSYGKHTLEALLEGLQKNADCAVIHCRHRPDDAKKHLASAGEVSAEDSLMLKMATQHYNGALQEAFETCMTLLDRLLKLSLVKLFASFHLLFRFLCFPSEFENSVRIVAHFFFHSVPFPKFLSLLQVGQLFAFYVGRLTDMTMIGQLAVTANPDNHYVYGMLAFALEEEGRMEEAEVAGKKAIELAKNESDPWALHALAHVYYNTLRFRDGIELLGPEKENWKDCNSFMYTHNWWHYSLFLLDSDLSLDTVISIFDKHVWSIDKACCQAQINAASLLIRLQLRAVDVSTRVLDVAKHMQEGCAHWFSEAQHDLLMSWAFGYAISLDDSLPENAFLSKLSESSKLYTTDAERQHLYENCAHAMWLYGRGNYRECCKYFEKCDLSKVYTLGASVEQSSVFSETYIHTLVNLERFSEARQVMKKAIGKERTRKTGHWLRVLKTIYAQLNQENKLKIIDRRLDALQKEYSEIKTV